MDQLNKNGHSPLPATAEGTDLSSMIALYDDAIDVISGHGFVIIVVGERHWGCEYYLRMPITAVDEVCERIQTATRRGKVESDYDRDARGAAIAVDIRTADEVEVRDTTLGTELAIHSTELILSDSQIGELVTKLRQCQQHGS